MLSDWQRRKLTHRFGLMDRDGSGTIQPADFSLTITALAQVFDLPLDDDRLTQLEAAYRGMWEQLLQVADRNADKAIDADEYLDSVQRSLTEDDGFDRVMLPICRLFMYICDTDGDGIITTHELGLLLTALGVPADQIERSLAKLQPPLTVEQVIADIREFYTGDDPDAPGSWILGAVA